MSFIVQKALLLVLAALCVAVTVAFVASLAFSLPG